MQQFLFVVEVPKWQGISTGPHYPSSWTAFASSTSTILKKISGCKQLQMNVWLLPAEGAWPSLESIAALAKDHDLSYTVVLIPDGAQILTPTFKP